MIAANQAVMNINLTYNVNTFLSYPNPSPIGHY